MLDSRPPTWLESVMEHARVNDCVQLGSVWFAFSGRGQASADPGRPLPLGQKRWPFEVVERGFLERKADVLQALGARLSLEVDPQQAAMFMRRLDVLLQELDAITQQQQVPARCLRAFLFGRIEEFVDDISPLVLRTRGLIDFVYTQVVLLKTRSVPGYRTSPTLIQMFGNLTWNRVTRGVLHASVEGFSKDGPVHANVLKVDRGKGRINCRRLTGTGGRQLDLAEAADAAGAIAAFSGGFFLFSESDIRAPEARHDPVGLLQDNGEVVSWPIFNRPALVQDVDGFWAVRRLGMRGCSIGAAGISVTVEAVNAGGRRIDRPTVYTRAFGLETPRVAASWLVVMCGRVQQLHDKGPVPIPLNGLVLALPRSPDWDRLASNLTSAGRLSCTLPRITGLGALHNGMAGGPTLLGPEASPLPGPGDDLTVATPPVTLASDETRDENRLPRLAVGMTAAHDLVVLAIDGRHFDRALGTTLRQTASILHSLGCVAAMNLDGGSSKRLLVDGRQVDLSSTDIVGQNPADTSSLNVRPVQTAVLLLPS